MKSGEERQLILRTKHWSAVRRQSRVDFLPIHLSIWAACSRTEDKFPSHLVFILDPLIKPPHSLKVRTLLRKRLPLISQVRSHSKAMLSLSIQRRLESLVTLREDAFDVGPVVRCVRSIELAERNTDGSRDSIPLISSRCRRMSSKASIKTFALSQEASDILSSEAVSNSSNLGSSEVASGGVDGRSDDGFDLGLWVSCSPGCHIEAGAWVGESVCRYWITTKQIWHHNKVASLRDGVSKQAIVDKLNSEDVGQIQDCCAGIVMLWVSQV